MNKFIITYSTNDLKQSAKSLSELIGIPLVSPEQINNDISSGIDYCLYLSDKGLALLSPSNSHGFIRCDFVSGVHKHRRIHGGGNGQMIAKAVGVSGKFFPNVLDLTAGLGSDGFVLASLGCDLVMLERNPIVYQLLKNGLDTAKQASVDDSDLALIINRIKCHQVNSLDYLNTLTSEKYPDVIYIDPMFPSRKKSARVKKEMQALHQIVGADEDASEILENALNKAIYRIVVKRPAHSDYLGMIKPNYSLEGKSTRYDIFAKQKIPK